MLTQRFSITSILGTPVSGCGLISCEFTLRTHRGRSKLVICNVVNAILYLLKTGCQWAMLPKEYPNHNSVYFHVRRWSWAGVWEGMNSRLREQVRTNDGRDAQPSTASIDSQSAKTTAVGGERCFDGGKQVRRRKRTILVDTMGNLLKAIVTAANLTGGKAAIALLKQLPKALFTRLKRIWSDGGYRGTFIDWVHNKFQKIAVNITLRSVDLKGFEVIPWP